MVHFSTEPLICITDPDYLADYACLYILEGNERNTRSSLGIRSEGLFGKKTEVSSFELLLAHYGTFFLSLDSDRTILKVHRLEPRGLRAGSGRHSDTSDVGTVNLASCLCLHCSA